MATSVYKKYDQGTLDYFNKNYGGIENYAKTQDERYKTASTSGDRSTQMKLLQDAARVGYSLTPTPNKSASSSNASKNNDDEERYVIRVNSYENALKRANEQLDPVYQRAVANVKSQQSQDVLNTSEIASARGGAHSGLAADAQNKVYMNASNQIADLDAQRASEAAQIARADMQRNEELEMQQKQQDFSEWLSRQQLGLQQNQFDYTKESDQRNFNYQSGRDNVADSQWQSQFDYGRQVDDRNYNYQVGRDRVADSQWDQTFNASEEQRKIDNAYNQQVLAIDRAYKQGQLNLSQRGQALDEAKFKYSKDQDAIAARSGSPGSGAKIDAKSSTDNYNSIRQEVNKASSLDEAFQLLQANSSYLNDTDYKNMYAYITSRFEKIAAEMRGE